MGLEEHKLQDPSSEVSRLELDFFYDQKLRISLMGFVKKKASFHIPGMAGMERLGGLDGLCFWLVENTILNKFQSMSPFGE